MNRKLKLAVVMDPIESINPKKDTTVQLLNAAQRDGFAITYLPQNSLYLLGGNAFGLARNINISLLDTHNSNNWYQETHQQENTPLTDFDVILMRKDPPFTLSYIYTTYILEIAEKAGVLVLNKPQSLRDANEKLFATQFPHCCAPTLVSQDKNQLYHFWKREQHVVFKPLDGMAGQSIFVAHPDEPNVSVIIETLTRQETMPIMAQRYLPDIHITGDKRIILIHGEPIPFALARFPAQGETRGNLAVGGKGVVVPLTERDYWLCQQIASTLKEKKIVFVGLDVIGDYITEINVTSPTGLVQIASETHIDIAEQFIKIIKNLLIKQKNDQISH